MGSLPFAPLAKTISSWWRSATTAPGFLLACSPAFSIPFSRPKASVKVRGSAWTSSIASSRTLADKSASTQFPATRASRFASRFSKQSNALQEKIMADVCTHLDQIRPVKPKSKGCEECIKMGDTWVHLRLCLTCGHVGCCDSSKNKHATKHFHGTKHPIVRSIEPGENWMWCYVDELMFEED